MDARGVNKAEIEDTYILKYLEKHTYVDVLNKDFIDGFVSVTGSKCNNQAFGAPKCRAAGKALGRMFKSGVLSRFACGLPIGDSSMGFPKWVFSYQIRGAVL